MVRRATILAGLGAIGGSSRVEGYLVVTVSGGDHATPNLAYALNQEVTLNRALTTIDGPTGTPGPTTWTLFLVQDSTGARGAAFDGSVYLGAAALPGMLNLTADTYSALTFVSRLDGMCALVNILTGLPIA